MDNTMKKVMQIIIKILLLIIGLVMLYLSIPYSKLKSTFNKEVEKERIQNNAEEKILDEESIQDLPEQVKRFYNYAGYIGKPQFTQMKMYCEGADFVMDTHTNKTIRINYTEEVFAIPTRLAFIDARLYGIPFQGLDQYVDGKGSMRGVLAKNIQLFHVTGKEMDEAALATWLCEAILLPKAMLNEKLQWQQMDGNRIGVTLEEGDLIVSTLYEFDKEGRLISATTDNRGITESDGSLIPMRWRIVFDQYEQFEGYYLPRGIKAMWQQESGDLVYFDSNEAEYLFK